PSHSITDERDELATSHMDHGSAPGTRCASLPHAQAGAEASAAATFLMGRRLLRRAGNGHSIATAAWASRAPTNGMAALQSDGPSNEEPRRSESAMPIAVAPGGPGSRPTWTSSAKDLVTTALGTSRVWVTLGYGILNEVYWP